MDDVMSRCPVCQARMHVGAGDPAPAHRADGADPDGSDTECPGTGQPTK